MQIIGITGGIASGKNFVADIFQSQGAAIFDADAQVHALLNSDQNTISEVTKQFPQSLINNQINRQVLGKIVFADSKKRQILEDILHPKVRQAYQKFLQEAKEQGKKYVVLNIPLLLETNSYDCDKIIAITITPAIQKDRFLQRAKERDPEAFEANKANLAIKFEQIRASQISNEEREKVADFVINNDKDKESFRKKVMEVIADI